MFAASIVKRGRIASSWNGITSIEPLQPIEVAAVRHATKSTKKSFSLLLLILLLVNWNMIGESVSAPTNTRYLYNLRNFTCINDPVTIDEDFNIKVNLTAKLSTILAQLFHIKDLVEEHHIKIKNDKFENSARDVGGPYISNIPKELNATVLFTLINNYIPKILVELYQEQIRSINETDKYGYMFNITEIFNKIKDWLSNIHRVMRIHSFKLDCEQLSNALGNDTLPKDYRNAEDFYASLLMHKLNNTLNYVGAALNKAIDNRKKADNDVLRSIEVEGMIQRINQKPLRDQWKNVDKLPMLRGRHFRHNRFIRF